MGGCSNYCFVAQGTCCVKHCSQQLPTFVLFLEPCGFSGKVRSFGQLLPGDQRTSWRTFPRHAGKERARNEQKTFWNKQFVTGRRWRIAALAGSCRLQPEGHWWRERRHQVRKKRNSPWLPPAVSMTSPFNQSAWEGMTRELKGQEQLRIVAHHEWQDSDCITNLDKAVDAESDLVLGALARYGRRS